MTKELEIALEAVKNGIYYQYLDGLMGYDKVYLDYNTEYQEFVLVSHYLNYAELKPYKLEDYKKYWWLREDKSK